VADEDKSASLGFHIYSDANQYALQIDDIKIKDLGLVASTQEAEERQLVLRPNPANEYVIVDTPPNIGNNSTIELYNTQGQLLKSWKPGVGQEQFTLQLHELPAGIFIVKWSDGTKHWTQRVVKVIEP